MKHYTHLPTANGAKLEHVLPPDHRVSCERCARRSGYMCQSRRIQAVPFDVLHDCDAFVARMGFGRA